MYHLIFSVNEPSTFTCTLPGPFDYCGYCTIMPSVNVPSVFSETEQSNCPCKGIINVQFPVHETLNYSL